MSRPLAYRPSRTETAPRCTTATTVRVARMSSAGSSASTTKLASLPGSMVP